MSITIKTERIIVRGEQKRKIIGFSLLGVNDLPKEYANGEYVARYDKNRIAYRKPDKTKTNHGSSCDYIRINEILSDEFLQQALKNIRRCGNRLQEINARLAKENVDWHGEETIII